MRYVYLLRSVNHPAQRYVGISADLQERLKAHNSGKCPHTLKFAPWQMVMAIKFLDSAKAVTFERYLKSGSGRAFAEKHFW